MPRPALVLFVARCLAVATAVAPALVSAQAASDTVRLPVVVVTADRVPRPLGSTTASVTVLDGAALRLAGIVQLGDALRLVPGLHVARAGSTGAQTSLFLRGGESDYVRVLVDGVPMNDPGGSIDLANLTTDNVDRVEIVRGPTSVLYGSDAVTGVIQIFTRTARRELEPRLAVRSGSHNAALLDASIGTRGASGGFTAGVARQTGDGSLAFNNQFQSTDASARGDATVLRDLRMDAAARLAGNSFHYPTDGAGQVVDHNAYRTDRRTSANLALSQPFGPHVEGVLSLGSLQAAGRTRDAPDGPDDTLGFYAYRANSVVRRHVAGLRMDVAPSAGQTVSLGVEWQREAQRSIDSSNYDVSLNRFNATRRTRAIYAQLLGERGRVSYSLGGRYDDNDVYGAFRTARLGGAVRTWPGARLRVEIGSSFKAPTFLETFSTAFSVGNPSLRPERARSWEGGLEQELLDGRLSLAATWFDQRFRDLIQYTFRSPTDPNYFNVAAASARGLELTARLQATRGVVLEAGATALRSRVDDAGFDDGEGATFVRGARLLRRPPLQFNVNARVDRLPRTRLSLSLLRVGVRDDRDFSTFPALPVELPGYTRVDVGGDVRLSESTSVWRTTSLTLRLENLFDARYSEIQGFPAPGRLVLVGMRLGVM